MDIKIDIKNLFKELNLDNSYFISSHKFSKEEYDSFPNEEYKEIFKNESIVALSKHILNEKNSSELIEHPDGTKEYKTGLLVFTQDEFRTIITEIEKYINENYERKRF
jgi:hypothetical protein